MSCFGCAHYRERTVPNRDGTALTVKRLCTLRDRRGTAIYDREFCGVCKKYTKKPY